MRILITLMFLFTGLLQASELADFSLESKYGDIVYNSKHQFLYTKFQSAPGKIKVEDCGKVFVRRFHDRGDKIVQSSLPLEIKGHYKIKWNDKQYSVMPKNELDRFLANLATELKLITKSMELACKK